MNTDPHESDDQPDDSKLFQHGLSMAADDDQREEERQRSLPGDPPLVDSHSHFVGDSTGDTLESGTSTKIDTSTNNTQTIPVQRMSSSGDQDEGHEASGQFPSVKLLVGSLLIFMLVLVVQIIALRTHLQVVENQIERDATVENYEQIQAEYEKQAGSWQKLTSAQQDRLESQRSDLASLQDKIAKLTLAEKGFQQKNDEAKGLTETTLSKLKIAREDLAEAEASLQVAKARQIVMEKVTADLQGKYAAAKAEVTETEKLVEQSVAALASQAATLKRQKAEMQANEDQTGLLATAKIELAGVRQETENAKNILADIQTETKRIADRRTQLVLELKTLETKRNTIEDELANLSSRSTQQPPQEPAKDSSDQSTTKDLTPGEEATEKTDSEKEAVPPSNADETEDQP